MVNNIPTVCPSCKDDLFMSTVVLGRILLVCLAHGVVHDEPRVNAVYASVVVHIAPAYIK